jgi:hypothetical protein
LACEVFDDVGVGVEEGFEAVPHFVGDLGGIGAFGETE